jgi:DUF1365 family protein
MPTRTATPERKTPHTAPASPRRRLTASFGRRPAGRSLRSGLYEGSVRHRRMGAVEDEFRYPLFMAYLDLDELPSCFDRAWLWSARRPALAWFRRSDYLGDPSLPLADAVRELVAERTGTRPDGPIRLLTHLRYFGKSFNPVSFYYCFGRAGEDRGEANREQVVAVVADVTNTPWGESHSYVMGVDHAADHGTATVMRAQFDKQLHVSPLMAMDHVYDWRLTEPGEQLLVHIESHRTDGSLCPVASKHEGGKSVFDATLSLHRRELTPGALRSVLLRYPFLTTRILVRIYTHALRLKLRGAKYFPHPERTPA